MISALNKCISKSGHEGNTEGNSREFFCIEQFALSPTFLMCATNLKKIKEMKLFDPLKKFHNQTKLVKIRCEERKPAVSDNVPP